MIALLRGALIEKHPNQAIVETGGVGYDVTIPVSTYTHLPETGAEVRLRIHTHVREDSLALYGFLTQDEKRLLGEGLLMYYHWFGRQFQRSFLRSCENQCLIG